MDFYTDNSQVKTENLQAKEFKMEDNNVIYEAICVPGDNHTSMDLLSTSGQNHGAEVKFSSYMNDDETIPPSLSEGLEEFFNIIYEKEVPQVPCAPPPGPPAQDPFPGPYNFTATVAKSKKCYFSERLNKMYVDLMNEFAVEFHWDETNNDDIKYVRSCVVFLDKEHAEQRVECCLSHRQANVPENVRYNVLQSSRALGTLGVSYHGHPSSPDTWYSTLAVVGARGERKHAYRFVCTNSCSAQGIKRRNIGIVFTIEDSLCNVYGRVVIAAKACACPARDMGKEEQTVGLGKRKTNTAAVTTSHVPRGKRPKIEPRSPGDVDDAVYTLPQNVSVVGGLTLVAGLECMVRMSQQALQASCEPARRARLQRSVAELRAALAELRAAAGIMDL